MDIKVKLALYVVGTKFTETRTSFNLRYILEELVPVVGVGYTYWASSHVTIFERPIRYNLVNRARAVNMIGAITTSHSSRMARNDLGFKKPSA